MIMGLWNSRKEAFVSDLVGSPVEDVVWVTLLPSVLVVVYWCVVSLVAGGRGKHSVLEFLILVVPQIAQLTREDRVVVWMACGLACSAWIVTSHCHGRGTVSQQQQNAYTSHGSRRGDGLWRVESVRMIQDAVSLHRAQVMLMTCLAILAVDFPVFPRKYAKTEIVGTSLMDAGVGSIVLCSSYVEGLKQMQSTRYRQGYKKTLKGSSFSSLMRVAMLVLLGVGRPVALMVIGYHVHVGEYGMHWNFFLTLAVLRACISNIPRSASPFALGIILLCGHQYGLSRLGLAEIANAQPSFETRREMNLFYQNKEGIISLPGYLALHFLGVWCAKLYIWLVSKPRVSLMRGWNALQIAFVGFLWGMYWLASTYIGHASRRTCNATFVLWMLAINLQAVVVNTICLNIAAAFLERMQAFMVDMEQQDQRRVVSPYIPPLLNSVNKGMLYVFLLSNILTGAINSVIDTLGMNAMTARGILLVYMTAVYVCTRRLFP